MFEPGRARGGYRGAGVGERRTGINNSRSWARERAAQLEACSKATHPPPPNPAHAHDLRLLWAFATHSQIGKTSPRAEGPAAVLMMLAGWPPGSSTGAPKPANGCETRACRVPKGLRARARVARWKNRGSDETGSRAFC